MRRDWVAGRLIKASGAVLIRVVFCASGGREGGSAGQLV